MSLLRKPLATALLLLLASGATTAFAEQITCESENDQPQACGTIERGSDVRMVQQISNSPCIEGRSWGLGRDGDSLWVSRGCRAVFDVRPNRDYAARADYDHGDYARDRDSHRHYARAEHLRHEARHSCVNEVASRYSLDRDNVSTTDEQSLGHGMFAVNVDTPDGPMTCTVDNDGDVQSIERR